MDRGIKELKTGVKGRWLSGQRRGFAKPQYENTHRFESYSFRGPKKLKRKSIRLVNEGLRVRISCSAQDVKKGGRVEGVGLDGLEPPLYNPKLYALPITRQSGRIRGKQDLNLQDRL